MQCKKSGKKPADSFQRLARVKNQMQTLDAFRTPKVQVSEKKDNSKEK
jgi:hypothetical protein